MALYLSRTWIFVAILVAVANVDFAAALVKVLRTCAPFPIQAAVTNSLLQALVYLDTNDVDIVLLKHFLPDCRGNAAVTKLRQKSGVCTIVFARKLTREVEEQMKEFGADAVLSRDKLDPIIFVDTVKTVLEQRARVNPQRKHTDHALSKTVIESNPRTAHLLWTARTFSSASRGCRRYCPGRQKAPATPQKKMLRKLLGKPLDDLHTQLVSRSQEEASAPSLSLRSCWTQYI